METGLLLDIYDRLDSAVWIFDFDHKRYLWANKKALDSLDAETLEELQLRDLSADMSRSVDQRLRQYQQDFCRGDTRFSEVWTLYPKGKPRVMEVLMSGIRLRDGRMALLCEARDHQAQQPETIRSIEALLHTTVMISLFSQSGEPLYRNTAARATSPSQETRFHERFVRLRDIQGLLDKADRNGMVKRVAQVKTAAGPRWHELTIRACHDAVTGLPAYLVSEIDVTELHETKERAQYLASHDTLTGLSNRTYLQDRLAQMLEKAAQKQQTATLYLFDLDDFKQVNDSFGHAAGDAQLQIVAEELKLLAGPHDEIARLGGDEFLICHLERPDRDRPDWFGQALLEAFSRPHAIDGKHRTIGLSIGYVHYPADGQDIDQLMRHADLALYQAKAAPGNTCKRYDESMRLLRDRQRTLKKDLEHALQNEEFVLHYQPIASTYSNQVVAGEALLRWQHPEQGLIGPDTFIKIAEEAGLINAVGAWTAREVARFQQRLKDLSTPLPLTLNVSPRQLSDGPFLGLMQSLPETGGCDPTQVTLEITESVILGDIPNARETLKALKQIGYRIVIDDFGTGYSNLAYLHNYPIDGIKIDRMFMEDIASGGAIVKLILSLAKALDASVVAEGVETEAQRNWLAENGCSHYQGYILSPPVTEDRFLAMLGAFQNTHEAVAPKTGTS